MFSPSLLSMMWHSLQQGTCESRGDPNPRHLSMDDIVRTLRELSNQYRPYMPQVPMIGRGQSPPCYLREYTSEPRHSNHSFLHGRVPVDRLAAHFENSYRIDAAAEFLDLGTPLFHSQVSNRSVANCHRLLHQTATRSGKRLSIALIDRGRSVSGLPDDVGGKLQHAVPSGVDLDAHAVNVLEVLLERLDHHGLLPECEVYFAPVLRATSPIGLACFEHDNSVELLDAMKHLDALLRNRTPHDQPVFANLSLGTHVGPHDGNSPLEDFIRSHFAVSSARYLHVAAGNDGLRGNSAHRQLVANTPETLRLRLGPTGCTEVLVELWWDAQPNAQLTVEVELSRQGAKLSPVPLTIDSTRAGATLQKAGLAPPLICSSLFHATCHGNRSCIALALSAGNSQDLTDVEIDLTLISSVDLFINSWIVICGDERSLFVTGSIAGSIAVPATDPDVISVAGVTANRHPWAQSSRGPTANYGIPQGDTAPYLAHLVTAGSTGSGDGTSFASPRACADTASLKRQGSTPTQWRSAKEAAKSVVAASTGAPVKSWSPRIGFGALV